MSDLKRIALPDGRVWTPRKGWRMTSKNPGKKISNVERRLRKQKRVTRAIARKLYPVPKFTKEAQWHMRELAYSLLDEGRREETPGFTNLVKTASRLHATDRTTNMGGLSEDLMTAAGRLLRAAQVRDVGHALLNAVENAPTDGSGDDKLPWIRKT